MESASQGTWLPLECNPLLINDYLCKLGLYKDEFQCVDVYGIDEDLLQMVPSGVVAILMLFPISDASEQHRHNEQNDIESNRLAQTIPDSVWFTEQKVANACGTIGLLHAVFNNRQHFCLRPESFLAKFYSDTRSKTPEEKAASLSNHRMAELIHQEFAAQGQSEVPEDVENVNLHFNVFVCVDGRLLELDGRKKAPIDHGPTRPDALLNDSVNVIRKFMERDPTNIHFSMVALIANQ